MKSAVCNQYNLNIINLDHISDQYILNNMLIFKLKFRILKGKSYKFNINNHVLFSIII